MKTIFTVLTALSLVTPAFAIEAKKPPKPWQPSNEHHHHFTTGVQCPAVGPNPCVGKTVPLENPGY